MSDQSDNQHASEATSGLKRSVPFLVLFFCFILFPMFIIYSALSNLFQIRIDNLRQQQLDRMLSRLEYLEKYSSNSRYFHFLLLKVAEQAQSASNPEAYLNASFQKLRQHYPDDVEFVAWDASGKVIKELTDQKSYSYILTKLYEVLREVADTVSADNQAEIRELPVMKRNLNLVRQFLGRIFIPEYLKKPYLQGNDAGPLLTEFGGKFSSVWYRMGERISFLCFLSDRLIKGHSGLTRISEALNRLEDGVISGFTLSPDFTTPVNEIAKQNRPILNLALARFENISEPVFESENALICMSMPQPGIRTFCLALKNPADWSAELNRDLVFFRIVALLFVFYFLLFVYFRYKQQFFSIAWKLTGLFLFANLAPLAILGFITNDYLANRKQSLRNDIAGNLSRLMRDFDLRSSSLKHEFANELNQQIANIEKGRAIAAFTADEIIRLKETVEKFNPSDVYLVASSGMVFSLSGGNHKEISGFSFIEPLGQAILKFCNGIIIPRTREDMFSSIMSPEDSDFVRKIYRDRCQVIPMNLANIRKLSYWYIFGDRLNYQTSYFLILFWDDDLFHELYLNRYFASLQANSFGAPLFASKIDGKKSWSPDGGFPEELKLQMARTTGFHENLIGNLNIDGKPHLFTGLKGKNLNSVLLAALYPDSRIDAEIDQLRYRVMAGALLSLLLTLIIGQTLSKQFLTPISNLAQATIAIGAHNFAHRIPIIDEDEFGHLNQVFNRVIEGLGELEVAKIVQESLFPGNHFKAGRFSIFGRSVVMTTLGGDYYDCLQINDSQWGLIIGDVAGHGVPAGLMMAMAKASVLTAPESEKINPAVLTSRLHRMFFAIKNDRLKRMMTFQYFVMRPADGTFSFANAGHCFPIIIKPAQRSAELIEHVATPLGIGPRARYSNFDFKVEPGESLLLYTDGIAEAKNSSGEEFGYERLKHLAIEAWDPDPEVYYRKIFVAYDNWSARPDDDLTIIVVNHDA